MTFSFASTKIKNMKPKTKKVLKPVINERKQSKGSRGGIRAGNSTPKADSPAKRSGRPLKSKLKSRPTRQEKGPSTQVKAPSRAIKAPILPLPGQVLAVTGKPDHTIAALQVLTVDQTAAIFGVDPHTITDWSTRDGMPRMLDPTHTGGRHAYTYNLYDIMAWRKDGHEDAAANSRKARIEEGRARKIERENRIGDGLMVLRSEMEDILASRALGFMNYIERCLPLSRVKRAMKSQEELISIDHAMWKEICEAYVGAPVAEEATEPPLLPSPAATPDCDRDPEPDNTL